MAWTSPRQVVFDGKKWDAVWEDDAIKAPVAIPADLPTPPWPKKKPFTADGIDLKMSAHYRCLIFISRSLFRCSVTTSATPCDCLQAWCRFEAS